MVISSQAPQGEGSETISQESRVQADSKRPVSHWDNDIVRSSRKRLAAQKIMNSNYRIAANGCWEWTGGTSHGYGTLRLERGGPPVYAHRLSYLLATGCLSQQVLHKCDNPLCVNPTHLFEGTQADNMKDMAAKKRSCIGAKNGQCKLSEDQIVEIRRRALAGEKQYALAKEYGISQAQVSRIIRGVRRINSAGDTRKRHGNWKHGRYGAAQE